MTYNVHSCVGNDGRKSEARIAEVIRGAAPDVVLLQEVLSASRDEKPGGQLASLCERVGLRGIFGGSRDALTGAFGVAVLGPKGMEPMQLMKLPGSSLAEQRVALWVKVPMSRGSALDIVCVHLALSRRDRAHQATTLLGSDLFSSSAFGPFGLIGGDFNARPNDPIYRSLSRHLRVSTPLKTWPALWPMIAIDHVFVTTTLVATSTRVVANRFSRMASDHLPVVVELEVPTSMG